MQTRRMKIGARSAACVTALGLLASTLSLLTGCPGSSGLTIQLSGCPTDVVAAGTTVSLTATVRTADGLDVTDQSVIAAAIGGATFQIAAIVNGNVIEVPIPVTAPLGTINVATTAQFGGSTSSADTCAIRIEPVSDTAPQLVGLDPDKDLVLPFTVQAAYNDDTMFFHMSWEGDRGDTHDYIRYTNGAWQREGGPRRDAQATIDNDPLRGSTNVNSTIYESRVTFMLDDPTGPNAVAGFLEFGCTITCHDNSRAMPTWVNADGEVHKYLPDDVPGRLDLWHHRLHRANPIGLSDDQWVGQRVDGEGDGNGGSRHGDAGTSPYATASTGDDGSPQWVFDPSTTGDVFAFQFNDLFTSPIRYFGDATAANLGPNAPNPVGIDYADAVAMGYEPGEGDTVPRRRLRQTAGSRGDIAAAGTTFTPSASDPLFGRWDSNIQRALSTGNDDDTALVDGNIYNIAFAVHTGMVTVRDHYVSFGYTLSLDGGAADIQAVKISGSGSSSLPDFSDTTAFPASELNTFLPGIASYEFLIGENVGLEYIDPVTDSAVDQNHAGAAALLMQGLSCRDCHTVADGEAFNPPNPGGFNSGPMETLVPQRGGVNTQTPIPPQ